jgi:hypothetical protein
LFKSVSLGLFEFKNVEKSIRVFALANEGLRVPGKNEMEGKTAATGKKSSWVKSLFGIK